MIRRARPLLYRTLARRGLYPVFDLLGRVADVGTNRGNVDSPLSSGELAVLDLLDEPRTVVDVGANRGEYTTATRARWPEASVVAVDPSAAALAGLEGDERVRTIPVALGAEPGTGVLVADRPGSKLGRVEVGGAAEGVAVEVMTLDGLCRREGITSIDLLKVDVEGAELAVLQGASGLLAERRIGVVQFEFGLANLARGDLLADILDVLGGSSLSVVMVNGLRRVSYHPRLEQPLTRNLVVDLR